MSQPRESVPGVSVGIACRLDKHDAFSIARDLTNYLLKAKVKVYLENRIASKAGYFHFGVGLNQMTTELVKFVVSIGGDGTILRVFQNLPKTNPAPVLGVNVGSLGFLDATAKSDVKWAVKEVLDGRYHVEKMLRLAPYYEDRRYPDALNEVFICSSRPSKVLKFSTLIDGWEYTTGYADGVIISTPTGSSAYSLSAGGAFIDPRNQQVVQIVPVNPFGATTMRPLIVPASSTIEVVLLRPRLPATLVLDGQVEIKLNPASRVKVKASERPAFFIALEDQAATFYNKINKILMPTQKKFDDAPEEMDEKDDSD